MAGLQGIMATFSSEIVGKERLHAHPGSSKRRLASGMAGADPDHVIRIYQIHGYPSF